MDNSTFLFCRLFFTQNIILILPLKKRKNHNIEATYDDPNNAAAFDVTKYNCTVYLPTFVHRTDTILKQIIKILQSKDMFTTNRKLYDIII